MNAQQVDGMKSELVGLDDMPASVMITNRRGQPVAVGADEASARAQAMRLLQARRITKAKDRAWYAERKNNQAWSWAFPESP